MNFKQWKYNLRNLPWQKKWFMYLILLRPILDMFYFLKDISPIFSPLYIIGILTPILVITSIFSSPLKKKHLPISFLVWSIFLILNCFVFLVNFFDLSILGDIIRNTTPIFLFVYAWKFFRERNDIEIILFTFILSSIIPVLFLMYEFFISPISPAYLSTSRGGGARFQGFYADSFSYAIYFVGIALSFLYFFLKKLDNKGENRFSYTPVVLMFVVVFIGLISIKHTASWAVVLSLFILLFLVQMKDVKGFVVGLIFFLIIAPIGAQYIYETQINPLIAKEFSVIEGDAPIERSFNGRMSRWVVYFEFWNEIPAIAQFIGVSLTGDRFSRIMVSGNSHNDYIRQFFLTGFPGFIAYLIFLISILLNGIRLKGSLKFLVIGSCLVILLYSMSSQPTLYATLLYILFPIFSYSFHAQREEKMIQIQMILDQLENLRGNEQPLPDPTRVSMSQNHHSTTKSPRHQE